jgi:hypothetical protein
VTRRIPDGLIAKLVFVSGLIWILFGIVLFLAFMGGFFGHPTSNFPGLIPFFGFIDFQINFAVGWFHIMGLFLAPIFCVAVGLAICAYAVGHSQGERV